MSKLNPFLHRKWTQHKQKHKCDLQSYYRSLLIQLPNNLSVLIAKQVEREIVRQQ